MKLIIAGSRGITSYQIVRDAYLSSPFVADEIVSGGARGVDTLGEMLAAEIGIPVRKFPADWTTHGKGAGYLRNIEMADYADALLALWDNTSKGTQHMMSEMHKRNKPVYLVRVEEEEIAHSSTVS